jgi:hypothetical protein
MSKVASQLRLPRRTNNSLEDDIAAQRQQQLSQSVAVWGLCASWWDELRLRPFDVPRYLALNGAATIVAYLASSTTSPRAIKSVFVDSGPAWIWRIESFLEGPCPVLRCRVTLPDDPRNPLVLESPLNIRDGDVQEFMEAVTTREQVDIFVAHQDWPEMSYAAACFDAPGIAAVVEAEVNRAADQLDADATEEDYESSVELMESRFPSAADGPGRTRPVRLTLSGQPRNQFIRK